MPPIRRTAPFVLLLVVLTLFLYLGSSGKNKQWYKVAEGVGWANGQNPLTTQSGQDTRTKDERYPFQVGKGKLKQPGSYYSRVVVVGRTREENVTWLEESLPDVEKRVYVVDDASAPLKTPINKGNEAMVYLTYIIDNYDNLPDVMIFMHNHRLAWHNNDVLDNDSVEMIKRINSERVIRQGYMNLRCQWFPGCPDWMHPGDAEFNIEKAEQYLIARAWVEIFPYDKVPEVLAQPCCSQFAVSKELILSIEKERYIHYRDWIIYTKLKDFLSGRIWEYLWQFAFTGENYVCPVEHVCLCDGYGICFGDKEKYDDWFLLKDRSKKIQRKLSSWEIQGKKYREAVEAGRDKDAQIIGEPEPGRGDTFRKQLRALFKQMDQMKFEAEQRGLDPKIRAMESGLDWSESGGG